jgi:phospholipase C
VLDALTVNADVWSRTAFFLTFDENDGLFDHVPPPAVPSWNPDGTLAGKSTVSLDGEYFSDPQGQYRKADDTVTGNLRPYGLSARVPMYVVSPWSKGGWVSSQVFDHTSMGMFLEKRFGITIPNISPWHRAVCGDLTSAFDFSRPGSAALPQLPDTSSYAVIDAQQQSMPRYTVPSPHQPLFQERGTRFSRMLPYELQVHDTTRPGISVELAFVNTGAQGAVFHVYDKAHLDRIPRRYTVEAGKSLTDTWTISNDRGRYDLCVYGPNGFFRVFRDEGNTAENAVIPDVRLAYDREQGNLLASFSNAGAQACVITVRDMAYRSGGPERVEVPAGKTIRHRWPLHDSANWYDFSVTVDALKGYERRFAGRVENGRHGLSDPAMGTA